MCVTPESFEPTPIQREPGVICERGSLVGKDPLTQVQGTHLRESRFKTEGATA